MTFKPVKFGEPQAKSVTEVVKNSLHTSPVSGSVQPDVDYLRVVSEVLIQGENAPLAREGNLANQGIHNRGHYPSGSTCIADLGGLLVVRGANQFVGKGQKGSAKLVVLGRGLDS